MPRSSEPRIDMLAAPLLGAADGLSRPASPILMSANASSASGLQVTTRAASAEPEPQVAVVVTLELPLAPAPGTEAAEDREGNTDPWAVLGLRMRYPFVEAVLPDSPAAAHPQLRPGLQLTGVLRDGEEQGWTNDVGRLPEAEVLVLIAPTATAAGGIEEPPLQQQQQQREQVPRRRLTLRFEAGDGFELLQGLIGAGFARMPDDNVSDGTQPLPQPTARRAPRDTKHCVRCPLLRGWAALLLAWWTHAVARGVK